jgi:hypothetical protein
MLTDFNSKMMKAVSTSETSVNICQTTQRNILEDSNPHTRRHENLKSQIFNSIVTHVLKHLKN